MPLLTPTTSATRCTTSSPLITTQRPHYAEIGSPAVLVALGDDIRRIYDGDLRVFQIDTPALQPGMPLTFLRTVRPTAPPYRGSFPDPGRRAELQLDDDDDDTEPGFRLIIAGAAYVVLSVAARGSPPSSRR